MIPIVGFGVILKNEVTFLRDDEERDDGKSITDSQWDELANQLSEKYNLFIDTAMVGSGDGEVLYILARESYRDLDDATFPQAVHRSISAASGGVGKWLDQVSAALEELRTNPVLATALAEEEEVDLVPNWVFFVDYDEADDDDDETDG